MSAEDRQARLHQLDGDVAAEVKHAVNLAAVEPSADRRAALLLHAAALAPDQLDLAQQAAEAAAAAGAAAANLQAEVVGGLVIFGLPKAHECLLVGVYIAQPQQPSVPTAGGGGLKTTRPRWSNGKGGQLFWATATNDGSLPARWQLATDNQPHSRAAPGLAGLLDWSWRSKEQLDPVVVAWAAAKGPVPAAVMSQAGAHDD